MAFVVEVVATNHGAQRNRVVVASDAKMNCWYRCTTSVLFVVPSHLLPMTTTSTMCEKKKLMLCCVTFQLKFCCPLNVIESKRS